MASWAVAGGVGDDRYRLCEDLWATAVWRSCGDMGRQQGCVRGGETGRRGNWEALQGPHRSGWALQQEVLSIFSEKAQLPACH